MYIKFCGNCEHINHFGAASLALSMIEALYGNAAVLGLLKMKIFFNS